MRFTKWKAVGIAAGTAVLALMSGPSQAVGGTSTRDAVGVDYDAACIVGLGSTTPNAGNDCHGLTTYDGSTTATDIGTNVAGSTMNCPPLGNAPADFCLGSVLNATTGNTQMFGGIRVTATSIPAPGSTTPPDGTTDSLDLPSPNFTGAAYFNLFQNKSVQTNVPTNPVGGCTRPFGGAPATRGPATVENDLDPSPPNVVPVFDQYGSWKDGFHFFTNLVVNFAGNRWVWTVQVGQYDPRPSGGFPFYELGTNDGSGWHDANPLMVKGVNWDVSVTSSAAGTTIGVWVDGIFRTPDTVTCREGYFKHAFAKPGDVIAYAKGLTTANEVVTLPVTVPLSIACDATGGFSCLSDLTTVGGYTIVSDTTDGNSTPGLLAQNIPGIAFTRGVNDNHGSVSEPPDTLGDGPTCPTPTFGGLLPTNPLFTPDTACQIDDDSIARGSFLSELWDTVHGFTF
jgi:hypothetical protein